MYEINKKILTKLIVICLDKLGNAATLLLNSDENSPTNTQLYKEFAQMNEIISWATDLLKNYFPSDLFLFCQLSNEIEQARRPKKRPDKIDQARIDAIYNLMNGKDLKELI